MEHLQGLAGRCHRAVYRGIHPVCGGGGITGFECPSNDFKTCRLGLLCVGTGHYLSVAVRVSSMGNGGAMIRKASVSQRLEICLAAAEVS